MSKPQCLCLTQSGTRCKRYCQDGTLKCFQHSKMDPSTLRMLPSIDFTSETIREPVTQPRKRITMIDLTLDEPPMVTRQMVTRAAKRREIEAQLVQAQQVINQTRNPRETRNTFRSMQENLVEPRRNRKGQSECRVKPRPPRRPRPVGQEKAPEKEDDCCICYDCKVKEERFLKCGHSICEGCIRKLRSDKCPMCRAEIESKFISKSEKKKMQRRQRDDAEERNEEAYHNYMRALIQESGGNASLFREYVQ